jgi:hypothetical protein
MFRGSRAILPLWVVIKSIFVANDKSTAIPSGKPELSLRLRSAETTQIRRGFTSSPPPDDARYCRNCVVARAGRRK